MREQSEGVMPRGSAGCLCETVTGRFSVWQGITDEICAVHLFPAHFGRPASAGSELFGNCKALDSYRNWIKEENQ